MKFEKEEEEEETEKGDFEKKNPCNKIKPRLWRDEELKTI